MFRCSAASELGLAAQTLPTARAGCRRARHSPGTATVPGRAVTRPEMARWGGQGGWSRPGQMFKCLKNPLSADSLLGRVPPKRKPAFLKSQRMIRTQRFPQIISSCRFPSGPGLQPRKCQGSLQRAQAICPLMNSASSR